MNCYVCRSPAEKTYNVLGKNDKWVKVIECRYWKMPEQYPYCGAQCSLAHYNTGYVTDTSRQLLSEFSSEKHAILLTE